MQFNSIAFLFAFFPLFLLIFALTPACLKSALLVLASFAFYYFSAGTLPVIVLASVTLIAYFAQNLLSKARNGKILALFLAIFAGVLVFFKLYAHGAYLSAGMSFYIFQIVAWLIDVYRENMTAERHILAFSEQIVLFPKLLSGPIVAPKALQEQQKMRRFSLQNVYEGVRLLIIGSGMKVLIANRLGGLWAQPATIGYAYISTPAAWLALTAYAMQLYLDFWGYSLMAMGIGKAIGYDLPENFVDPYASRSISEFYRRWHATLGAWFRSYVYIPLGGNRHGFARTICNIGVVWLLTGLWHGVGGNYLLWAGFIFVLIVLERLFLKKWLDKSRILSHIYVIFAIFLSWIPFAIGDFSEMRVFLARLFGFGGTVADAQDYVPWLSMYAGLLTAGAFFMTELPRKIWKKVKNSVIADIFLFVVFWFVVYYIATAAQDPFLYFQY